MSASHLSRATAIFVVDCCQFGLNWMFGLKMELIAYAAIFVVDCCQFGPSWMFGLKMELMAVPTWLSVQRSKAVFFLILYDSINDMKYFRNCLHYISTVPQPFLLLIAANLAQAGCLGWKWSLWSFPAWLAVQLNFFFLLTLYVSFNDMKYFRNCLHYISAVPQPFLLLIAANLALTGFLG